MFRNFYAEQKMTDPRDSWYKPNLLYNIHYKPPKPLPPPKMMVVTKEFNPSVCICGKHGCKPHYRMEREVVWSNKEAKSEGDAELKSKVSGEIKTKVENKEASEDGKDDDAEENKEGWKGDTSFKDRVEVKLSSSRMYHKDCGNLAMGIDDVIEAGIKTQKRCRVYSARAEQVSDMSQRRSGLEQYTEEDHGLEKKTVEVRDRGVEGSRNVSGSEEMESMLARGKENECETELNSLAQYKSKDSSNVNEEYNKKLDRNSASVEYEKKMETLEQISSYSREDRLLNSFPRFDDLAKQETPDTCVLEVANDTTSSLSVYNEDFGSAFGIMSVYCDSELHLWSWKNEDKCH